MAQYLLSIYQPDGPPPPKAFLDDVMPNVSTLRQEMKAAGVWVFAAGLHPPHTATVLRAGPADVLMTDGPFVEGKEHIGGFTVIRAQDLDGALEWGRKLARILVPLSIEVRPIQQDGQHD